MVRYADLTGGTVSSRYKINTFTTTTVRDKRSFPPAVSLTTLALSSIQHRCQSFKYTRLVSFITDNSNNMNHAVMCSKNGYR